MLTACALLLASCAPTAPVPPSEPPAVEAVAEEGAEDFCAAGGAQSPIPVNPDTARPGGVGAPVFHYQPAGAVLTNTGKNVRADFAGGNSISLDGTGFELVEFHFHRPPEHTIPGSRAVMEAHLVHRSTAGGLAVVGVPIVVGTENTRALNGLVAQIPAQKGWRALMPDPFNPSALVPGAKLPGFRYSGSLTTPPYGECVRWTVYTSPVAMSQVAYDRYLELFKATNKRDPQPVNGRVLVRVEP